MTLKHTLHIKSDVILAFEKGSSPSPLSLLNLEASLHFIAKNMDQMSMTKSELTKLLWAFAYLYEATQQRNYFSLDCVYQDPYQFTCDNNKFLERDFPALEFNLETYVGRMVFSGT
nr:hypothetical protein [Tanacetum cinerariifolium]